MADVIATIWDFDKTLIPNYMQEPIFKHYKFDGAQFWAENRKEIQALRDQGLDVNEDSFYLNRFLEFSKKGGMFEGLNNDLLVRFGKEIEFYDMKARWIYLPPSISSTMNLSIEMPVLHSRTISSAPA